MITDYSQILSSDKTYIDDLYQQYLENPNGLEETWKIFFEGFEYGFQNTPEIQEGGIDPISIENVQPDFGPLS